MVVSHEYMLQAHRALQEAKVALGRAQNAVSVATATDSMLPPAGDVDSSYWGALQTSIATALGDVTASIALVYYTPEQAHS